MNTNNEPVFTQFRHNAAGAIKALKEAGSGIAVAALFHPAVGDIDLRWGKTSDDPRAKGHGLAKIIKWHPEVLNDLQGFISSLIVHQNHKKKGEIHLSDLKDGRAGIKLEWNGKTGHWLMTAYIKGASASKGTPAALDDSSGPTTATPNNTGDLILGFEIIQVNMEDGNHMKAIFDSVAGMSPLVKMKLMRDLNTVRTNIASVGAGALAAMKRLKLMSRLNQIRVQLGAAKPKAATEPQAAPEPQAEPQAPRNPTAHYYEYDP
ncbi:hypothetical protein, partial [Propionivibrio sp.]|uniref:putative barnase/colicin E5 family endoribonuclease n=1 Tax=Propionivibrio sp. TaxID=2212460 RepID=UPI003BF26A46